MSCSQSTVDFPEKVLRSGWRGRLQKTRPESIPMTARKHIVPGYRLGAIPQVAHRRPTLRELTQWSWMEIRSCLGNIWWILRQPELPTPSFGPAFEQGGAGMCTLNRNTLRCTLGIERLEADWPWVSTLEVSLFLWGFHLGSETRDHAGRLFEARDNPFHDSCIWREFCPRKTDA
jgi:hypothetical protein